VVSANHTQILQELDGLACSRLRCTADSAHEPAMRLVQQPYGERKPAVVLSVSPVGCIFWSSRKVFFTKDLPLVKEHFLAVSTSKGSASGTLAVITAKVDCSSRLSAREKQGVLHSNRAAWVARDVRGI
jgi:hypothetical protein